MHSIHKKTLTDLEYDQVLQQVSELCSTELGKINALKIKPYGKEKSLRYALKETSEYHSSFENNNAIPSHYFESITQELKLLKIEDALVETFGFKKISQLSINVNELIRFFRKFDDYYTTLHQTSEQVEYTSVVSDEISKVFDKYWEIKNEASPKLFNIRKEILQLKGKINESFNRALSEYNNADYLDDIRESVVENRRVLAVKAMYRRRVRGVVMGTSKTGSIVYIEPQQTERYTRELMHLISEEKEEINRILKTLTNFLRPYHSMLKSYQKYLIYIDIVSAKAKYATKINGILPDITNERKLLLKDAYHPLLYLNNLKKGNKTYPQTIELSDESRIIVISGPNAGGKSITLKTIGLLQLMIQSGMLIPVHRNSKVSLFDKILTDIGDNQSIENHLSTYSYRLKNMNYFLRKCDDKTLFLIDEFGTGSDPELGGALAETFLEEFYNRKAFGVITTHYANLKMLANELPHAVNANMLFDNRTLEPIFRLIIGEAGSSFTFEVAQKNGIPYSLINRAKKKIERGKVRFDATIAKLQKERSKMEKTSSALKDEESKARDEAKRLEELNEKIQSKLINYQELYDHNQRMIYLGNKINDIAEKYFDNKKKRPLISEFLRIVETENAKRKEKSKIQKKKEKDKKIAVEQELAEKIKDIRVEKKKEKKIKAIVAEKEKKKTQRALAVGDRVRLTDSRSVGSIDKIEKGIAIINYGMFTTHADLNKLELVEKKK